MSKFQAVGYQPSASGGCPHGLKKRIMAERRLLRADSLAVGK